MHAESKDVVKRWMLPYEAQDDHGGKVVAESGKEWD